MEQTALALISFSIILLVLVVGFLAVLIYKLTLSQKHDLKPEIKEQKFHPAILDRMKELEKVKSKRTDLFCPNHPEEAGETVCGICDKFFCKSCIKPFKNLHFCKEHIPLIMRYDWDEVLTIQTSTHEPDKGVELYDFKKHLFESENIPTFIETHYKINIDQDYIETYLVLYAQRDIMDKVRALFKSKTSSE